MVQNILEMSERVRALSNLTLPSVIICWYCYYYDTSFCYSWSNILFWCWETSFTDMFTVKPLCLLHRDTHSTYYLENLNTSNRNKLFPCIRGHSNS